MPHISLGRHIVALQLGVRPSLFPLSTKRDTVQKRLNQQLREHKSNSRVECRGARRAVRVLFRVPSSPFTVHNPASGLSSLGPPVACTEETWMKKGPGMPTPSAVTGGDALANNSGHSGDSASSSAWAEGAQLPLGFECQ